MSAHACMPGSSSEPGAGWAFAVAASAHHDVWLLTSPRAQAAIDAALPLAHGRGGSLTVVYVGEMPRSAAAGRLEYARWQGAARRQFLELHTDIGFEVAHHVMLSADWAPTAFRRRDEIPLVWGPVGGVASVPGSGWRWLGWRGALREMARAVAIPVARSVIAGRAARAADTVVLQNPLGGHRYGHVRRVLVESNAAIDPCDLGNVVRVRPNERRAVFVGRLVAWKGLRLAIEALRRPAAAGWTLDVFGDGADRARVERAVRRVGLSDRVVFHGERPRREALAAMASADVLLLPTLHDAGPWVVAEAISIGCPAICLDWGGPRYLLADGGGVLVPVGADLPGRLADALANFGNDNAEAPPGSSRWLSTRLPALVDDWYANAIQASRPATVSPGRGSEVVYARRKIVS